MTPAPRRQAIEAAAKAAYEAEWGTCPSSAPNKMLDQYLRVMEIGIAAYEAALWRPIEEAPTDGTWVILQTNSVQDLPAFTTCAYYDPDAGWCVDELREAIAFRPLPAPPQDPETKP